MATFYTHTNTEQSDVESSCRNSDQILINYSGCTAACCDVKDTL